MHPAILALSTAVPSHIYLQENIVDQYINELGIDPEKQIAVKRIYQNSAIHKRHLVTEDFLKPRKEWNFWGSDYPRQVPGMTDRNLRYKQEAPYLALEAVKKVLNRWGGNLSQITHLISVSCTGIITPGIEYYLMQELKLPSTINRLGINFMGCFGAFKGLSTARAFASENPDHRILLVCTELCSLHFQADQDSDTFIANSIFADGAAAAVIGGQPTSPETPLWNIVRLHSLGCQNSLNKMSWEASDRGFLIRLSHTVPVLLGRQIQAFIHHLLTENISMQDCNWAIHPGGKSILQAIEKALELKKEQTQSSWDILANYGNMSSATFLFVLDHLSQQQTLLPWTVGVGFGPGLSIEGILLSLPEKKTS